MKIPLRTTLSLGPTLGLVILAAVSTVAGESTSTQTQTQTQTQTSPASITPLEPNQLRLNFRNAPLDSVLNYLSDAAGFTIVNQTGRALSGKVSVWSNQPVTKDEAIDLLGEALDQNSYAFVLSGRTLTISAEQIQAEQRLAVAQEKCAIGICGGTPCHPANLRSPGCLEPGWIGGK